MWLLSDCGSTRCTMVSILVAYHINRYEKDLFLPV
jgi:hypothetical protein